jgi:hypothetical protein
VTLTILGIPNQPHIQQRYTGQRTGEALAPSHTGRVIGRNDPEEGRDVAFSRK